MIRTVVDQIYEELKRRLLTGQWGLGVRIFEEEISADLNVSRSAVREAVRLLEQEGLIVREPHRGLYVASPSSREAMDVAQLRAVLEAYTVRWGKPPSREVLEDLEAICRQMEDVERRGDHFAAVNLDRQFHAGIASLCQNAMLLKKYHELDGHIAIFFHWVISHVPGRLTGLGERHRQLAAVFARGDAELFGGAVLQHYLDAAGELTRNLPDSTTEARELAGDGH